MPDRISRYRQVRLIIDLPHGQETRCHWSLIALTVEKGIPRAEVVERGWTVPMPSRPGPDEIWEALQGIADDLSQRTLF